jgi:hypothetical protein
VHGVAGNFWLGEAMASGVLSVSCFERLCLAKTDSKILSATGRADAPSGPAIFWVDRDDGFVFFPETRTFARWHDDSLDPLDWVVDGEVLSMDSAGIVIRREGHVWIVRPDGEVVDWVTDTVGPVLLLADELLFAMSDELILRRHDGSELRFPLIGATAISAMSAHYAAIRAGDSTYALRIESGREQLFLLPGNPP